MLIADDDEGFPRESLLEYTQAGFPEVTQQGFQRIAPPKREEQAIISLEFPIKDNRNARARLDRHRLRRELEMPSLDVIADRAPVQDTESKEHGEAYRHHPDRELLAAVLHSFCRAACMAGGHTQQST